MCSSEGRSWWKKLVLSEFIFFIIKICKKNEFSFHIYKFDFTQRALNEIKKHLFPLKWMWMCAVYMREEMENCNAKASKLFRCSTPWRGVIKSFCRKMKISLALSHILWKIFVTLIISCLECICFVDVSPMDSFTRMERVWASVATVWWC